MCTETWVEFAFFFDIRGMQLESQNRLITVVKEMNIAPVRSKGEIN